MKFTARFFTLILVLMLAVCAFTSCFEGEGGTTTTTTAAGGGAPSVEDTVPGGEIEPDKVDEAFDFEGDNLTFTVRQTMDGEEDLVITVKVVDGKVYSYSNFGMSGDYWYETDLESFDVALISEVFDELTFNNGKYSADSVEIDGETFTDVEMVFSKSGKPLSFGATNPGGGRIEYTFGEYGTTQKPAEDSIYKEDSGGTVVTPGGSTANPGGNNSNKDPDKDDSFDDNPGGNTDNPGGDIDIVDPNPSVSSISEEQWKKAFAFAEKNVTVEVKAISHSSSGDQKINILVKITDEGIFAHNGNNWTELSPSQLLDVGIVNFADLYNEFKSSGDLAFMCDRSSVFVGKGASLNDVAVFFDRQGNIECMKYTLRLDHDPEGYANYDLTFYDYGYTTRPDDESNQGSGDNSGNNGDNNGNNGDSGNSGTSDNTQPAPHPDDVVNPDHDNNEDKDHQPPETEMDEHMWSDAFEYNKMNVTIFGKIIAGDQRTRFEMIIDHQTAYISMDGGITWESIKTDEVHTRGIVSFADNFSEFDCKSDQFYYNHNSKISVHGTEFYNIDISFDERGRIESMSYSYLMGSDECEIMLDFKGYNESKAPEGYKGQTNGSGITEGSTSATDPQK